MLELLIGEHTHCPSIATRGASKYLHRKDDPATLPTFRTSLSAMTTRMHELHRRGTVCIPPLSPSEQK